MQELNAGILDIYKKEPKQSGGGMPVEVLHLYSRAWYGEINFTTGEYYAAKQANTKIERRVRVLQDKSLSNLHVIIIDDQQYQVGRVYHGLGKDGRPITDITLERVTQQYDVK